MAPRPPIPAMPLKGGCLCGQARYTLSARPHAINACHCLDCKRQSSADAGVFLHQKRADFAHDSGELETYRKTADSGRFIDVVRCATCGTRLWHAPVAAPELVMIAAGTLDESGWAIPTSHIWMKDCANPAAVAPDAITFEIAAPDRMLLWERFAKIYGP